MKNQKKKGFTLIELLVVIAIIGLLATLSVVALNNARERARDTRRVSDIRQIQTALELYYNACDEYPDLATIGTLNTYATMTTLGAASDSCAAMADFISPMPESPEPGDGDCTIDDLASKEAVSDKFGYNYAYASDGSTYELYYCLGSEGQQKATPFTIGDL